MSLSQKQKLKNKSRRTFFRGVAAALGINAFNEAEGHGGGQWKRPHCYRGVGGNQANNATPNCGGGHVRVSKYYPRGWGDYRENQTYHTCHHWVQLESSGRRMCHSGNQAPILFNAGGDTGRLDCWSPTVRDPKGVDRALRYCERGVEDTWVNTPADAVICNEQNPTIQCGDVISL